MRKRMIYILLLLASVLVIAILFLLLRPVSVPETSMTQEPAATKSAVTPEVQNDLTAAQTITAYFECWNAQNAEAMAAYIVEEDRSDFLARVNEEFQYEASVKLISCQEQSMQETDGLSGLDKYKNAYSIVLVLTDYTVNYNETGKEIYIADNSVRTGYRYWLVRPNEGEQWMIAMEGY